MRPTGYRFVPRDVTARRMAEMLADVPDLNLNDDGDLSALFRHAVGWDPAPRWLPKSRCSLEKEILQKLWNLSKIF